MSRGLTQPEFGELLRPDLVGGLDGDTIGEWERGVQYPQGPNVGALKDVLGFSTEEIETLLGTNRRQTGVTLEAPRSVGVRLEPHEEVAARLKDSLASNDTLEALTAIKRFQLNLRKQRFLTDPGHLKHLVDIQAAILDDIGATHGFIEYSTTIAELIRRSATMETRASFVKNGFRAHDLLTRHYDSLGQPTYSAGSDLELAWLLMGIDDDESLRAIKRFGSRDGFSAPIESRLVRLSSFVQLYPRFLKTLYFLSGGLTGTYPALEAARVLVDCGIGPHRLAMRNYLHELRAELAGRGNVHEGCIVCTATAVELFCAQNEPGVFEAGEWLAQQRATEWRGRRYSDGSSGLFGYNYTASAMKALYVLGKPDVAREVRELLFQKCQHEPGTGNTFWDGVDVEPHVATGRVLEALRIFGPVPERIRFAACRFIRSRLKSLRIQRLPREYDTWSFIGLVCLEDESGIVRVGKSLDSILTAEAWESNGAWSQNVYRTAMFARLMIEAVSNKWVPSSAK